MQLLFLNQFKRNEGTMSLREVQRVGFRSGERSAFVAQRILLSSCPTFLRFDVDVIRVHHGHRSRC